MRPELRERNVQMLARVLSGATWQEAGASAGLTQERVRQVCHKLLRMMIRPELQVEQRPEHDCSDVEELRANKDYWLRQLRRLEDFWLSSQPKPPSA